MAILVLNHPWIDKVDKLLDMACIPIGDHVEFAASKHKGRAAVWWNQFQNVRMYQDKPPIRTWRWMKWLLPAHSLILEAKEMIWFPPFMRSYQSNETWGNISNHQLKSSQPRKIHQGLTYLQPTIRWVTMVLKLMLLSFKTLKRLSAMQNLSMTSIWLWRLFLFQSLQKKRS